MILAIVAGQYRGLKLHSPPPTFARPTAAHAREVLISIVADRAPGSWTSSLARGLWGSRLSAGAPSASFL